MRIWPQINPDQKQSAEETWNKKTLTESGIEQAYPAGGDIVIGKGSGKINGQEFTEGTHIQLQVNEKVTWEFEGEIEYFTNV